METAVDGMAQERGFIYRCFAIGLLCSLARCVPLVVFHDALIDMIDLCSLLAATCITMEPQIETIAAIIVVMTVIWITQYSKRVRNTFHVNEVVKFDDLRFSPKPDKQPLTNIFGIRKNGSASPRRKPGFDTEV